MQLFLEKDEKYREIYIYEAFKSCLGLFRVTKSHEQQWQY